MQANKPSAPHLRIRRAAFDERKREVYGDLPWYEVAERLGVDRSVMSLLRNGRRQPTKTFIASVLAMFGGRFEDWFEFERRESAA